MIKMYLKSRNGDCFADGVYEDGKIIVLKGGMISSDFADHIRGGRKAKSFRENPEYVDENRNIIKECIFDSPSTAAQFVTGRSINGYAAWKVEKKKTLGDCLRERGLR